MTDIYVNDRDLASYGVTVSALAGWADHPGHIWPSVNHTGRQGQRVTAIGLQTKPRALTVGIQASPGTLAARRNAMSTLYLALQGMIEVRVNDDPTRLSYCYLEETVAQAFGMALVNPDLQVQLKFIAEDPLWYNREPSMFEIPVAQRVLVPMGSADGGYLFHLTNIVTSTVFTLYNKTGIVLNTMTLTGTLGAGEYLALDTLFGTIKRVTGGTVVDAFTWKATTDLFHHFDAKDAPRVALSAGVSGVGYGRKAHLA